MSPCCTYLFCIPVGLLRNVQGFICNARSKPLCCDVFAAVVACINKVPAVVVYKKFTMSTYQCSVCFYICGLNLEFIEKFQASKAVLLVVFHTGKVCPIRSWKFREIHTGIFGRMDRGTQRETSMKYLFGRVHSF